MDSIIVYEKAKEYADSVVGDKVDKTQKIAGVDLQNDITAAELKTALNVPTVPTNISAFTNDANYLTLATLPIYNGGVQ